MNNDFGHVIGWWSDKKNTPGKADSTSLIHQVHGLAVRQPIPVTSIEASPLRFCGCLEGEGRRREGRNGGEACEWQNYTRGRKANQRDQRMPLVIPEHLFMVYIGASVGDEAGMKFV